MRAAEAHGRVGLLQQGIAEAPSRQDWCNTVFRLYGPNGTMIRGLMRRQFAGCAISASMRRMVPVR